MGIFSGLESFGLGRLKDRTLYEEENNKAAGARGAAGAELAIPKAEITEKDVLLDKKYTCPLCDKEFTAKIVRTGKAKLLSADSDLRPKYSPVDSTKYEAIVCPHCGYAALNKFFPRVMPTQARMIKENICRSFKGLPEYGEIYTYDEAIGRYKLALVNTVVKKAKLSERAYTCLKLAWVIRGKQENLPQDTENYAEVMKQLKEEEDELIRNAYEGFESAFSKENFPLCGMDEPTAMYLVADLARRSGEYEKASRWVSQVITLRSAPDRVKEKARMVKELIAEDQRAAKAKAETEA